VEVVRAAGGLVWRDDGRARRIALVHRPRREDWSLPKGKLEDGERWDDAAVREVREETGCEVQLAAFAGVACYETRRATKVVLYWNMTLVREGPLDASDEIDEVAWLLPSEALERLDHESDRRLLREALDLRVPEVAPQPAPPLAPRTGRAALAVAMGGVGALALAIASGAAPGAALLAVWLLGGVAGSAAALLSMGRRRSR
jgi:8-oxo-dGTP diphosphatase